MSQFIRLALIAFVALVGPRWIGLVGEASASFRAVADNQLTFDSDQSTSSTSTASEDSVPQDDSLPHVHNIRFAIDAPADAGGAGSSSSSSFSSGASGVISEMPSPAITFVARLWLARERVAVISPVNSVLDPPRPA